MGGKESGVPNSLQPRELQPARLLCSWDSPGEHTGVGCHFLLQGIFSTQGLNPGLLHCRQVVYGLSYRGSPCGRCRDIIQHFQLQPLWQVQGHHAALSAAAPVAGAGTSCSTLTCSPRLLQACHDSPPPEPITAARRATRTACPWVLR